MSDVELIVNDSKRKNGEYMPMLIRDAGRLATAVSEYQLAELRIEDGKEFSMGEYIGAIQRMATLTMYDIELVTECLGIRYLVHTKLAERFKKISNKIKERILTYGE